GSDRPKCWCSSGSSRTNHCTGSVDHVYQCFWSAWLRGRYFDRNEVNCMARRTFLVLALSRIASRKFVRYAAIFLLVPVTSLATCGRAAAATLSSEASVQSVALGDVNDLIIKGGQAEPIMYQ